ncbi:metal ABC transporter ATP-binding protein [Texcoconibacillus texcoconensis]|uniref:ABC-type Mn2+/Zn2+ transport system ATPase subunit n=1 Tax=Texcoconibacillus texcoconensis TaxID=1095777 RepID=A0A840QSD1_9BACI|nr:metal ABC transporter ATP-binding protein [Texcoconibacillus texcoconensis]MBB5174223.1 ABC-type Mn2+/Zn2+ transport system ATPase subunit [Texcoconibacillus texcoconensis]
MNSAVQVKNLSVSYYGHTALEDISFEASPKQLIGIIGPNGAGKSTLIKAIMGMVSKNDGEVTALGQSISKVRKRIAYVPQRSMIDFDFPVLVEDVVVMGSYPHLKWWKRPGKKEREIALDCLRQVGMLEYRKRQIGELSGGQQQRVFLARALAQDGDVFFLDEPFAGIDVSSENIIIDLLRKLRDEGKTIFVVHHDLSKVEEYFDSLMLLNKKLIGYGDKAKVFQPDLVSEAYNGNIAMLSDEGGKMVVTG